MKMKVEQNKQSINEWEITIYRFSEKHEKKVVTQVLPKNIKLETKSI